MKTKAKYEIELAASTDENREVINNVQLNYEKKCLIATDGRILAIIPVEVDNKDSSGPISPEAFKTARKGVTKKQKEDNAEIDIVCHKKILEISNKDGSTTTDRLNMDSIYPNYKQVIPRKEATLRITFNPEYLLRVARAIGSRESVTVEFTDALSPITVYPAEKDNDAFGIVMPIRGKLDENPIDYSAIKAKYL